VAIAEAPPLIIRRPEDLPGSSQTKSCQKRSADLVQTSCGMGVPLFDYKQERGSLVRYWTAQGVNNLRKYWGLKKHEEHRRPADRLSPDRMAPPQ
jgi:hypothetical protein